MRIQTGRVVGSEIKKNRDGLSDVMMLKVEMTDPDDIQLVELFTPAGDDYNPPNDTTVAIVDAGNAWKIALVCDDGIVPSTGRGEKELYSSKEGAKIAIIKLLANGDIEINNTLGSITLNGITGQCDINGNFTVDV